MRRVVPHWCRLAGGCAVAAWIGLTGWAGPVSFTAVRDIRDMPRPVLATNPVVYVRGLITCANAEYKMIFVQDETAGIFLFRYSPTLDLSPGDRVELKALAARGRFSPILDSVQVLHSEKAALPVPPRVAISRALSGELDGQRVEVHGMVERVSRRGDHLWLGLAAGDNALSVAVPLSGHETVPELLDTRLRVRGVVASSFKQDQLAGFQVFANGLHDLEVLARPSPPAFELPVTPASELSSFQARRVGEHRVHLRGVVALHWPGSATVLQDETGATLIEGGGTGELKAGDEVEVAGFIAAARGENKLRHAEVRVLRSGQSIAPQPVTLASSADMANHLVRVVGRIVEWQPHRQGETLALLAAGNDLFTAVMRDAGADRIRALVAPGTTVNLTGVWRPASDAPGARPSLWLRTPADVAVLQPAPASPLRWVIVAGVLAGLVVLATGGAVGVFALYHRRILAATTARHREAERTLDEMERQFRRAHRDREYIARELHDNIVQSIFSVGLGIDEARRLAKKEPHKVEDRLDVAVQTLNKIIRDVRAFIGGLEPKSLEGHELKTALKSVLLASGEDQEARFSLQIDASAARELTSMQATELFNIAKEAMANAMRHSHARLTTVSLVPRGRGVRLEVADDGVGFDPNTVPEQGMGLRNLRERARNIGAKLDIVSAPGHGTRIVADIPISTHDNN